MKIDSDQDDLLDDPEGNRSSISEGDSSNCWVFIVVNHQIDGQMMFAKDVLADRMKRKIWLVNSKNPNVKRLNEGDEVIFYLGGKQGGRGFAGIGVLTSKPCALSGSNYAKYGSPSSRFDKVVELRDLRLWKKVKPVAKIVPRLNFIKNKRSWGAYLQGGIVRISKQDFELLIEA